MKKLPEILPEYKIEKSEMEPFGVKCEELMGFCVIPRLNEKNTWGSYDVASGKRMDYTDVSVIGKAEVHGIEGVEILAKQYDNKTKGATERRFVAQLTDTHCRYLAESHVENGVRRCFTSYYIVVVFIDPLQGLYAILFGDTVDWFASPTTRWLQKGSNHSLFVQLLIS